MRSRAAHGLCLLLVVVSCRQILGIEQASLDPGVTTAGGSDSGSGNGGAGAGAAPIPPEGGDRSGGGLPSATGGERPDAGGAAGAGPSPEAGRDSGDAGAGGTSVEPTLCERYCSEVQANCEGPLAVYTSQRMCLAVCARLPPGEAGDGDRRVNSVHCRLEAALSARISEPEYSCPIAGPGGNGACGTNCEAFCQLRASVCAEWLDLESSDCMTDCAALPDLQGFTVSPQAVPSHTRGPHVQCRLYHVSASATDEPDTHCLHADGASPCVDL